MYFSKHTLETSKYLPVQLELILSGWKIMQIIKMEINKY